MSYKASSFFQDILVNEYFYIATKSKQLIRHEILGKDVICVWTQKETAETFLNKHDTDYDKIKKIDIDRFVTYEMDDVFAEGEEVLMNASSQTDGDLVNIIDFTNELMSDLDEIIGKDVICVWTQKETSETFLNKHDTDYDKIKKIDIDRFVTYEMDDVFAEGEEVLMNASSQTDGDLVNIIDFTNELMSDLDEI